MPFRFRPRIGPFVYTPPAPRTEPVTRGEDLAGLVLVMLGVTLLGAVILLCAVGDELWAGATAVLEVVAR